MISALNEYVYLSCMCRCHTLSDYHIKEIEHTCMYFELSSYTNTKCHGLYKAQQPLTHRIEICAAHTVHYASCEDYINNTTQADKTPH